ncbi:hypothetical protein HPT25_03800 [Bacillus sp. BRMEA1]|uniref:hypothetical protein n=1 Tax=Neobacillus endophyticus TaxID=2738405 RepID=UPI001566DF3C|nr:hypothetical protein [Neobacillus endophyticus]NRD76614.1 hypothetical protein [Neobacillus endophyticus]
MLLNKRKYLFFIKFSIINSLFLSLLAGCALYPNKEPLVINKYDEAGNEHLYKTINSDEKVKEVKKVLNNAKWANSKFKMERKPDYTFYFDNPNAKAVEYRLWITQNKKQIEVSEGIGNFAKLSVKDSEIIFSIFEIK